MKMKKIKWENIFALVYIVYMIACIIKHQPTLANMFLELCTYSLLGVMMYYIIYYLRKGRSNE